jgi:hypothetical protein
MLLEIFPEDPKGNARHSQQVMGDKHTTQTLRSSPSNMRTLPVCVQKNTFQAVFYFVV